MKSVITIFMLSTIYVACDTDSTMPTSTSMKTTVTTTSTTPKPPPTTTLTPEQECGEHNGSCDDCVKIAKCLYCKADDLCKVYPVGHILPRKSDCPLSEARWGVCWLNFEALIIAVSVIGALILISTCCCIYCCCCRSKGNKKKFAQEEAKWERQKQERKSKSDERRAERKSKLDEIRKKYGLVRDEHPYEKFDA